MYPNTSHNLNKETKNAVYFFTPPFYPLDNYSAHKIILWRESFPTAEHTYQWKKFAPVSLIAKKILQAGSPEQAKKIADENKAFIKPNWHEIKVDIMREILTTKTQQHDDVRDALLRTGLRIIVEHSPVDSFWGSGPDENGKNWVGKIWKDIRNTLH